MHTTMREHMWQCAKPRASVCSNTRNRTRACAANNRARLCATVHVTVAQSPSDWSGSISGLEPDQPEMRLIAGCQPWLIANSRELAAAASLSNTACRPMSSPYMFPTSAQQYSIIPIAPISHHHPPLYQQRPYVPMSIQRLSSIPSDCFRSIKPSTLSSVQAQPISI